MIKTVKHFRDDLETKFTDFDKKSISIERCGKKINVYDWIQSNNVDTDIYEVARKYGQEGDEITCANTYLKKNFQELQNEFNEYTDLRSVLDKQIAANNMWNNLPIGVRSQFNNSIEQFIDNGQEWLNNFAKQKQAAQAQQEAQAQQTTQKEVNNEPK